MFQGSQNASVTSDIGYFDVNSPAKNGRLQ